MADVRSFIARIVTSLGADPASLDVHVSKLEADWYTRPDLLAKLSIADWRRRGFPELVYREIRAQLGLVDDEATAAVASPPPPPPRSGSGHAGDGPSPVLAPPASPVRQQLLLGGSPPTKIAQEFSASPPLPVAVGEYLQQVGVRGRMRVDSVRSSPAAPSGPPPYMPHGPPFGVFPGGPLPPPPPPPQYHAPPPPHFHAHPMALAPPRDTTASSQVSFASTVPQSPPPVSLGVGTPQAGSVFAATPHYRQPEGSPCGTRDSVVERGAVLRSAALGLATPQRSGAGADDDGERVFAAMSPRKPDGGLGQPSPERAGGVLAAMSPRKPDGGLGHAGSPASLLASPRKPDGGLGTAPMSPSKPDGGLGQHMPSTIPTSPCKPDGGLGHAAVHLRRPVVGGGLGAPAAVVGGGDGSSAPSSPQLRRAPPSASEPVGRPQVA